MQSAAFNGVDSPTQFYTSYYGPAVAAFTRRDAPCRVVLDLVLV